jgi:hypothetical protein
MSLSLARWLLLAEAVTPEAMSRALAASVVDRTPLVRALLTTRAIDAAALGRHLERGDAPYMRNISPVVSLVEQLPAGFCERLLAVPVRRDPRTGTVDLAVVDAGDAHVIAEAGYWLDAPIRAVRTSLSSLEAALKKINAVSARPVEIVEPSGDAADAEDPNIPFSLTRRSATPPAPPATLRGPFGAPSFIAASEAAAQGSDDFLAVLDAIDAAKTRDAILELVVMGARTFATAVAVLAVRQDKLVGWTCSPEFADPVSWRGVRLSAPKTDLGQVIVQDGAQVAELPQDPEVARVRSVARAPLVGKIASVALRVEGKPVAVVLAVELTDGSVATRRLDELSQAAGSAIAALLRRKRPQAR